MSLLSSTQPSTRVMFDPSETGIFFFSPINKATELSSVKKTKFAKGIILNIQLQIIVELLLERVKQT